ncbi:MAG: hypothetical protein NT151_09040 [Acidobacteria bacterium]|nr:hypothetical protein [Acidobacteriota bacterium]
MKRRFILILASAMALVVLAAGRVDAQPSGKWSDAGYLHVDGGVQTATPGFTSNVTFKLYGEDGTLTATYKFVNAALIAGRGGFRIWGNVGLGLGVSRFTRAGEADISARLPHPFYFSQFRDVSGTANGLKREETMVSAELSWLLRPAGALDVMLFAGPAYFTTRQDMATLPRYTESYPFDSATLTGVESRTVNKTGVGFTAGLDLSYLFNTHMGLGSLVRFSRATATFSAAAGSESSVRLGGIQASAGLRIRF